MKRTFLLLLLLVLSSNICQPLFARTAKEYFHQESSSEAIMDELYEGEGYDSIMSEIRAYVIGELLPSMDSNSIAYVDTLFKYLDYVSYHGKYKEQTIELARQARRIVLAQEGKSSRYAKSIKYELYARGIYGINIPEAEVTRARQLFGELIDYYHQTSRPTDEDYINTLEQLFLCVFVSDICPIDISANDSPRYELVPNWAYMYNEAAFVWNDLLTWSDITKEEYDSICSNYIACIMEDYTCLSMYGECKNDRGCETFSYRRYSDYQAYLDLLHAHVQLLLRTNDTRYYNEVADLVNGLQWRAYAYMQDHDGEPDSYHWIDTAYMHSKNLIQAFPISSGTDASYFIDFHLAAAVCRMSAEGYTADLQSELKRLYNFCNQGIKNNRKQKKFGTKEQLVQNIEDPLYEYAAAVLTLQAEGELLNGNGKSAVKLQRQACKMADKFSMAIFEEPASRDYAELLMIAVADHDKKTFDELKRNGLIYYEKYWKEIIPRLRYTPYRYILEQRFRQNEVEILGKSMPRDHASLTNDLVCERIWQPVLISETDDEGEDDEGDAEYEEWDEEDNSADEGYSYSDSSEDSDTDDGQPAYRPVKVKIGNLYYFLYDAHMTASVISPGEEWKENNLDEEEDFDEEEDEIFVPYNNLKNVTIPATITHNGFKYRVTEFGNAFNNCQSLQSIRIPANIKDIDEGAFNGCDNLKKITVASNNRKYCSVNGILFNKYKTTLRLFPAGRKGKYVIPESVTSIARYAFAGSQLTALTVPEGVTSMYNLHDAKSLTTVVWNAKNCSAIPNSGVLPPTVSSLTFGNNVEYIPSFLCYYNNRLTSVTIPASVTHIGRIAFGDSIRSVIWNAKNCEDFASDEEAPFYNTHEQITSFVFGEAVEHIPAFLCADMNKLPSVNIPQSVTSIGDVAFWACDSLHSVNISANVTHIGSGAFGACEQLKAIHVAPDNQTYCSYDGILLDKEQTTVVQIPAGKESFVYPNGITRIGDFAYAWCSNLTHAVIDDAVTDIGYAAFRGCQSLQSVAFGKNLTECGINLFEYCENLTSVVWNAKNCTDFQWVGNTPFYDIRDQITSMIIGEDVEHIPARLSYECYNMTSLTIGNNVTSIDEWAFTHCLKLTELTLPGSLKQIGALAFFNLSDLKSVTCLAETPPAMGTQFVKDTRQNYGVFFAIDNEGSDIPLYVPAGSVEAYRQAEQWKDFKTILPIKD